MMYAQNMKHNLVDREHGDHIEYTDAIPVLADSRCGPGDFRNHGEIGVTVAKMPLPRRTVERRWGGRLAVAEHGLETMFGDGLLVLVAALLEEQTVERRHGTGLEEEMRSVCEGDQPTGHRKCQQGADKRPAYSLLLVAPAACQQQRLEGCVENGQIEEQSGRSEFGTDLDVGAMRGLAPFPLALDGVQEAVLA